MLQVPVEDLDVAPGHAIEWKLKANKARVGTPQQHQDTTYNQVKHFTAAQESCRVNDPIVAYVGGTFEIEGLVDLQALEAALLHLVRRHEVLRCTFQQIAGDLSCDVLRAEDVTLERFDRGTLETPGETRKYLHRFFQQVDPLSWPLIVMGAVQRPASTTVYFACDHLVSDGLSTPIAVHDIATAYSAIVRGRHPALPEVGSYLSFSREQRRQNAAMDADDRRLDYWKSFMARNGGFFPPFPLDLGLQPHRFYPTVNETTQLLESPQVEAMEAHCRAANGRLFMGLLAAVGVSLRKEGGPQTYRTFMPVSERNHRAHAHTMGWFINTMPLEFSVAPAQNFTQVLANARQAVSDMQRHIDVPFVQAWRLLAPEHFSTRSWPIAGNFFSYLDFRKAPGAHHHHTWRARKHIWASHSNGICFWLHRADTGLYINCIFADTPQARQTKAAFTRTLKRTTMNIVSLGTF
ncbi:condensation domain-containing protein [Streptomyces sp. DH10]|uniref:condensation domain-containing protein n=1 Tax=Streptomyces sp. DH10 TaxID=3040121 RepID=UPI002442F41C|nr:condensation domain-containing protein [Streptomyces sp. DH10]MDG9709508.1 condensation domain-containing protein [Streptomyces sp. DH10]